MGDIPPQALNAAAAAIERELMSGTDYTMAADSDEALARVALTAAVPHILTAAHDDLAAAAKRLEDSARASNDKTHLGTAAGVRLAAFRLIELANLPKRQTEE